MQRSPKKPVKKNVNNWKMLTDRMVNAGETNMTENAITRTPQLILVGRDNFFERLYQIISTNAMLMPSMKFGLEGELHEIECILEEGEKIDHYQRNLLVCHLRNIRRLSPFTAEVLIAALSALPVMRELVNAEPTLYLPGTEDVFLL